MTIEDSERFWSFVQKGVGDACWLWTKSLSRYGYGQQWVGGKNWITHRLAWTLTNGEIPKGLCLCHRCDNPACVRPDHMFLGTQRDNLRDMRAKGRERNYRTDPPRGELNGRARLTVDDVREIRRRAALGVSHSEIGRAFKYHRANVAHIVNRRVWKHVD